MTTFSDLKIVDQKYETRKELSPQDSLDFSLAKVLK
jgi:hypothetical protein